MAGLLTRPPFVDGHNDSRRARSLVVVAHRGPVRFASKNGQRVVRRNAGGLVTALRDVVKHVDHLRWLCAASSAEDRAASASACASGRRWSKVRIGDDNCEMRMLPIDAHAHRLFYAVIANPLLWFVQHNLWDHASAPDMTSREHAAWDHGYVEVNEQFANALADRSDVPQGSIVMVHDYHFYLVPALLRDKRPDLFVDFFVHIPWPQTDAWRVLPARMREAVFSGLLGSDVVGFHTERYARNFLLGCEELLGLPIDLRNSSVRVGPREVAVRHYPISVDATTLRTLARSPEVAARRRELQLTRSEKLILRVDRTDPSKNIVRGFRAYARMLQRHPELHRRVTFLAQLQPSRQDVRQYADYIREIHAVVASVNGRYGGASWQPIDLRLDDDLPLAFAAYSMFDALLVNPVADGMNLVAKEALVLNETDGVLLLSENAGAYDELGAIAVTVQPFDIEQQSEALYAALTMPRAERKARREIGADIVQRNDVQKWLTRQLSDIDLMRAAAAVPAR